MRLVVTEEPKNALVFLVTDLETDHHFNIFYFGVGKDEMFVSIVDPIMPDDPRFPEFKEALSRVAVYAENYLQRFLASQKPQSKLWKPGDPIQ